MFLNTFSQRPERQGDRLLELVDHLVLALLVDLHPQLEVAELLGQRRAVGGGGVARGDRLG